MRIENSLSPKVIYQDKNFLAIDKPAGLLVHPVRSRPAEGTATAALGHPASNGVHPTATSKESTLVDWLLKHYPEIKNVGDPSTSSGQVTKTRPGIVHRLDRDTSGIMLVARNQKYFEYLKNLFQTRAMRKTYRALVYGRVVPQKGIIEKDIRIKSGTVKRTVFKGKSERAAITEYKVLKYFVLPVRRSFSEGGSLPNGLKESFTWVEVEPLTGRTHQIRVHLASIGHPVVGDKIYTPKKYKEVRLPNISRQMLHAYSLEFSPAPGKRLKLAANLPDDMRVALRASFH